jgi:hypothetical protein
MHLATPEVFSRRSVRTPRPPGGRAGNDWTALPPRSAYRYIHTTSRIGESANFALRRASAKSRLRQDSPEQPRIVEHQTVGVQG